MCVKPLFRPLYLRDWACQPLTPCPLAFISRPCATSPARHEFKKAKEAQFHLIRSSWASRLAILSYRRWTRSGKGTSPTTPCTTPQVLLLLSATLPIPLLSCTIGTSHYARVLTRPSSTATPSEIRRVSLAPRACVNPSDEPNGEALPHQQPATSSKTPNTVALRDEDAGRSPSWPGPVKECR